MILFYWFGCLFYYSTGHWILKYFHFTRYYKYKVIYLNLENLEPLRETPHIVLANHIKPRDKALKFFSAPYDFFLIKYMILKETERDLKPLARYDSSPHPSNRVMKFVQSNVMEHFIKGIAVSLKMIPLHRKANTSQNKETLRLIRKHKENGNHLMIFPEGKMHRGFRKGRKFYSGFKTISQSHNLPLLPIYIDGYNANKEIRIIIGKSIKLSDLSGDPAEQIKKIIANHKNSQK